MLSQRTAGKSNIGGKEMATRVDRKEFRTQSISYTNCCFILKLDLSELLIFPFGTKRCHFLMNGLTLIFLFTDLSSFQISEPSNSPMRYHHHQTVQTVVEVKLIVAHFEYSIRLIQFHMQISSTLSHCVMPILMYAWVICKINPLLFKMQWKLWGFVSWHCLKTSHIIHLTLILRTVPNGFAYWRSIFCS